MVFSLFLINRTKLAQFFEIKKIKTAIPGEINFDILFSPVKEYEINNL
jgi:hypothetical protein